MPPQRLKDKVQQFKGNDDPQNRSRIVVEGVDEPKRGRDYDRILLPNPLDSKSMWQRATRPGLSRQKV